VAIVIKTRFDYFNTCTAQILLFFTMTNKCTIISQIITLLHVSTLSCHPRGACNQYLAKLHKYFTYIPGQHDSNIYIQTVYSHHTDWLQKCSNKMILAHFIVYIYSHHTEWLQKCNNKITLCVSTYRASPTVTSTYRLYIQPPHRLTSEV